MNIIRHFTIICHTSFCEILKKLEEFKVSNLSDCAWSNNGRLLAFDLQMNSGGKNVVLAYLRGLPNSLYLDYYEENPCIKGCTDFNSYSFVIHCGAESFRYSEEETVSASWVRLCGFSDVVFFNNMWSFFERSCFLSEEDSQHMIEELGIKTEENKKNFMRGKDMGIHTTQTECVRLERKKVFHSNRYFLCIGTSILLCSSKAKKIIENSDLRGIDFLPVYLKSSKEPLPDIFQISTSLVLPNASVVNVFGGADINCPKCGIRMIIPLHGDVQLGIRKNVIDDVSDIAFTEPMIGDGGYRLLLISKKAFLFFREKEMLRGIGCVPLLRV